MTARLLLALFFVTTGLLLAGSASAQFDLSVDAEPLEAPVPMGGTATSAVTVVLTVTEAMVCAGGGAVDVALTVATSEEEGFGGGVSPDTVSFDFDAGLYGVNDTVGASTKEGSATLNIELGDNISRTLTSHDYVVTGDYDATAPEGCQTASGFAEASDSATVTVEVEFPDEPMNGDMDDDGTEPPADGDGEPPADGDGEDEDGPAPGLALLMVLIATAAFLVHRRR